MISLEKRKLAQTIAKAVKKKYGRGNGAKLIGICPYNFSFIEKLSTRATSRNELYCASVGSVDAVIDWYRRTGGILD